MKIDRYHPKSAMNIIALIVMFWAVSCGNAHEIAKGNKVVPESSILLEKPVGYMPIVKSPVRTAGRPDKDTLRKVDQLIQVEYQKLSVKADKAVLPYDTLVSYNKRWQSLAFTLFDRGIRNRDKADRSEQMFNAIQDSLTARDKRDMAFRATQVSVKHERAVQKETFNMFNIILLACLTICTLHAIIELIKWIMNKVNKPSHA